MFQRPDRLRNAGPCIRDHLGTEHDVIAVGRHCGEDQIERGVGGLGYSRSDRARWVLVVCVAVLRVRVGVGGSVGGRAR